MYLFQKTCEIPLIKIQDNVREHEHLFLTKYKHVLGAWEKADPPVTWSCPGSECQSSGL